MLIETGADTIRATQKGQVKGNTLKILRLGSPSLGRKNAVAGILVVLISAWYSIDDMIRSMYYG